jgi:hypothetical protein
MALRYASVNDDVMEFERLPEDADELAGASDILPVRRP